MGEEGRGKDGNRTRRRLSGAATIDATANKQRAPTARGRPLQSCPPSRFDSPVIKTSEGLYTPCHPAAWYVP